MQVAAIPAVSRGAHSPARRASGSGVEQGHVRPRAQSPVAVTREDSRLGVEKSQRFWLTSPTLGRVSGTVVQIAGEGMPKTRENRPLQPKPGGVKTAVMKRTGSSAVGSRWPRSEEH